MQQKTIIIVLLTLLIGGGSIYLLTATTEDGTDMVVVDHGDLIPPGMHRMPDGSLMSHEDMMMDHSNMLVTSERAFIEGMIPHHQEAIDTSREVLERGATTAEIRVLAENIITTQELEVAEMKEWYEDWYGEEYQNTGEYVPMMRDLSQLSGAELDRVFLEDMIVHHMGAVMMAENIRPHIENDEMNQLTTVIIETQTEEIALIEQLLADL